jgi:hypothetical protein
MAIQGARRSRACPGSGAATDERRNRAAFGCSHGRRSCPALWGQALQRAGPAGTQVAAVLAVSVFHMPENRTVTTLKYKRDEITRSIAAYEKKLIQARADLAHINAAIRIFEHGGEYRIRVLVVNYRGTSEGSDFHVAVVPNWPSDLFIPCACLVPKPSPWA